MSPSVFIVSSIRLGINGEQVLTGKGAQTIFQMDYFTLIYNTFSV